MKEFDAADVVFIIWVIVMVITVFVIIAAYFNYNHQSSIDNQKIREREEFCKENPCICRCEYMGNGGLEECTYLCRGGY
jgi:hypothetical protein